MIQLRIQKESDLYNPYDPSQTGINEKVYGYLRSFCTETEYEKHLHDTLQIITDSPVDGEKFKAAVQKTVKKDLDEFDAQLAENNRRAIWEYIVGFLLSAAGVAFSLITDQVLLALISFFGSMFLSDAISIHTKVNLDIKRQKKRLEPLCDFDLEVIKTDASSPDNADLQTLL